MSAHSCMIYGTAMLLSEMFSCPTTIRLAKR
jgi:hypothetical protein